MRHYVEHHIVCSSHGICTDAGEVMYAAVYIIVDNTFRTAHTFTFHRQQCRENGSAHS